MLSAILILILAYIFVGEIRFLIREAEIQQDDALACLAHRHGGDWPS
jgi:hypothetical protein